MAYKFQVGAFRASGSLTAEGNLLADASVLSGSSISLAGTAVSSTAAELNLVDGSSAGTIVNSKAVIYGSSGEVNATTLQIGGNSITATAAEINLLDGITRGSILVGGSGGSAELDAKTSGRILVGDGTDIASVAVSGDATLAANGALTIAATAIEGTMLNSNVAGDGIQIASNAVAVDVSDFAGTGLEDDGSENLRLASQGTGIAGGAGSTLSVAAAQTSITSIINASFTKLGTATNQEFIDFGTSNQIKFGIDNTDEMILAAGGLSITNGLQLGAGESLDVSSAGALKIGDDVATSVVIGDANVPVRIVGNLIVEGTTTSINAATIQVTSSFTFEGSTADGNETVLNIIDPDADRTVSLPNQSGVVALLSPSLSDSELATALTAAPSELNLMAAGTAIGSAVSDLADSDGFIVEDGNTMKKVQLSSIKTYIGGGTVSVTSGSTGAANFALQKGVNVYNTMGAAATAVLLTGSSMSHGESIKIKAGPDCSVTNTLTISTLGSDTIDGTEDHIVLESPNAAVEFIYVAQGDYRIF